MVELIAQGDNPNENWRRPVPEDRAVVLGSDSGVWSVAWDRWISRQHVEVNWCIDHLRVRKLPSARNPVFFHGEASDTFEMAPGDCFVIGRTVFTLERAELKPSPGKRVLHSRTITAGELQRIPFQDAPHHLDVLSRLPQVIARASSEMELLVQLVNLLLAGLSRAGAAAIVTLNAEAGDEALVEVLHWDSRQSSSRDFKPSKRLVRDAIDLQKDTVLHVWTTTEHQANSYTQQENFDWAFCTPVRGDACKSWGIYATGRSSGDASATLMAPWAKNELGGDLKFAELVAAILSSLRQVQLLQHKQAILRQFFSPTMLPVLMEGNPEAALKPRQTDVTVLFCDLRGFSRKVENEADNLFAVLQRVSQALGVMTQNILEHKGVIADFQGDAAMAFWGWPINPADKVVEACRAALGIRTLFESFVNRTDHPLTAFQAGIGVATGNAVAGQIGTADQAKVTVFGPVVNRASRLESMTKIFRVPILLDEATAKLVKEQMPPSEGRCRRLAKVKPYGLETAMMVTELLPSAAHHGSLTDEHLADYETALEAFLQGNW